VRPEQIFVFIHQVLVSAYTGWYPSSAIGLFVRCASLADKLRMEEVAYEFMAQAFIAYEEYLEDPQGKPREISLIIGALESFRGFSDGNWNTLVQRASQHAAKLRRKEDKATVIADCAHLYWPSALLAAPNCQESRRNDKKLLKCLQRALKAANECINDQVEKFVMILNKYLFFFERRCPTIGVKYLQGLICLIEDHLKQLDDDQNGKRVRAYYANTIKYIKSKQLIESGSPCNELEVDRLSAPLKMSRSSSH